MRTVLIVDDLAIDRLLAGGLLTKEGGWRILYANDGREALKQIELHLPDIVVTDMQMPEMNGLELVSQIRSQYALMPIVLMTAQGSEELAVQALQAGAASYVPKRNLAHTLVDTVNQVFDVLREQRSSSRVLNRMIEQSYSVVVENDLDIILATVAYLRLGTQEMGLVDDADRLRVGIALEEAMLNAFYHGNLELSSDIKENDYELYHSMAKERCSLEPYAPRKIHVSANFTRERAIYRIRDEGPGFDPSTLPDPTDPANLERASGRGVLLMRTFMDSVDYNATGNEVTLVKHGPSRGPVTIEE